MEKFDFSGWATKANLECSDGRTILKDAFKHHDGETVPLVWNHQHNDPNNILGHALLENREEGVYAYCEFNDSESGKTAKELVQHGDVHALSIYANRLQQDGNRVIHGIIREVSLVLAGANPGAYIDTILAHGEESREEAVIYTGEEIVINHSDEDADADSDETVEDVFNTLTDKQKTAVYIMMDDIFSEDDSDGSDNDIQHADSDEESNEDDSDDETVEDVFNTLTDKQKTAVYYIIDELFKDSKDKKSNDDTNVQHADESDDSIQHADINNKEDNTTMKTNVFDQKDTVQTNALTHSDLAAIIDMAKGSNVGSLKRAMDIYREQHADTLQHGFETEALAELLPDYKNINPGAPDIIRQDQSWVMGVINKIHKSPYSRIRTRHADARAAELKAKGYQKKGDKKTLTEQIKLIGRSHDPQTVYIRDDIHRDDIVDITDFNYVDYVWGLMKDNMYETLALAALIGDGRDDLDPDKIKEEHICPIWKDNDLYTLHRDVDVEAAKTKIQGTNSVANFSENYIFAEAIIEAALYAREDFKGSGTPDFYCAPHTVNVMLLARDLNGRRIYDSKADLAKALNVNSIVEIEQLADKTRTTEGGDTKKLLGLFVNLSDYQFGNTKGGEVAKFDDFDIDFNKYKYLMETRLSGALTKLFSAIALELPVTEAAG